MRKNTLNFFMLRRGLIKKITDSYTRIRDRAEERPQTSNPLFIFLITFIAFITIVFWVELWLPFVVIENAKWALSAQTQATAALLGLLIAAMALRWRTVTNQEQQLRSVIHSYLKVIGTSGTGPQNIIPTIKVIYDNYLVWINSAKPKIAKLAYINLGRLWVIMRLSYVYRVRIKYGRYLKRGQTKRLSKVSKLSRESAISMWENYYRHPANFILDMYETLDHVSMILTGLGMKSKQEKGERNNENTLLSKYDTLREITSSMLSDDSKLIAEETKRIRSISQPFIFTSVVLTSAIVIGLLALTGINNTNLLLNLNSDVIRWVVGIPIGLSVYGVFLCLIFVRNILS